MNSKLIAAGVIGLVALAFVGVVAVGFGPFPGGDDDAIEDFPMATGTPYSSGDDGAASGGTDRPTDADGSTSAVTDATATAEPTGPPFRFSIDSIERCGETCRDVTVTLYNNRDVDRSDVVVYTRIFAGNSTDEGDLVWEGREPVGSMAPGESVTRTKRVELSISEALAVQNHDGWITLLTTVDSAEHRVTYKERRDVIE